jgi:pimeloyl-ACP methyl ester carboxylesterase
LDNRSRRRTERDGDDLARAAARGEGKELTMVEWVTRPGGRRLAYEQFGDPAGAPVLFCHGWMASRLTRHPDDALTASLGVRLIAVDRAGIGRSDADPGKTLLSAAADLAAVADALGLERFGVFGHSGGGPYALATACAFPDRVTSVAVASGFAPFDRPDAYAGMTPRMRGFVRLLRAAPWLAGPMLRSAPRRFRADAEKAFAKQFGDLCDADRAALASAHARELVLASAVEALRGGHAAVAVESQLLFVRPWGFSPAQVRRHVELWYGEADTLVPPNMGHYLDEALPDSRLTLVPDAGHMLYAERWAEILESLRAAVVRQAAADAGSPAPGGGGASNAPAISVQPQTTRG